APTARPRRRRPMSGQSQFSMSCAALYPTKIETFNGGRMIRRAKWAVALCVALGAVITAQTKTVPRPPAQAQGQQPPGESAAPDGYQPLPAWMGQTRAPAPAKTETFTVDTVTEGLNGAWFKFLPDGRILLGERTGTIKIIGKDGKAGEALTG